MGRHCTLMLLSLSQVAIVLSIVFSVILYRLAVAGAIYSLVSDITLGPSVGDIVVAVTGAGLQLVAIIIMNKLYEFVAFRLTNWGEEGRGGKEEGGGEVEGILNRRCQ